MDEQPQTVSYMLSLLVFEDAAVIQTVDDVRQCIPYIIRNLVIAVYLAGELLIYTSNAIGKRGSSIEMAAYHDAICGRPHSVNLAWKLKTAIFISNICNVNDDTKRLRNGFLQAIPRLEFELCL